MEGEGSMTAAVGLVQLHRVQTDNHPIWFLDNDSRKPYAPTVYGKELIMSFLHHTWWCNHRENVILRDFSSSHAFYRSRKPPQDEPIFSEDERRLQLVSALIAPGGLLLCDPMRELLKRKDLLRQADFLYPVKDGCTEVLDPFPEDGSPSPSLYRLSTPNRTYLAVFNWGDSARAFTVKTCKGKPWRSLFTGQEVGPVLQLAPHSAVAMISTDD